MSESWYEVNVSGTRLTQGDLIFNCPILTWITDSNKDLPISDHINLQNKCVAIESDVVVMTQACDLENNKVKNLILCSHYSLKDYKDDWESAMKSKGQNPTKDSWAKYCNNIRDGYCWNLAMLNKFENNSFTMDHRVVDFHEVYSLPRDFLELLLKQRDQSETFLRLRVPYREYLSQAFARYFMRVGLPTPALKVW
jgi:hypothetical protein